MGKEVTLGNTISKDNATIQEDRDDLGSIAHTGKQKGG
jgi:hypothetical protein